MEGSSNNTNFFFLSGFSFTVTDDSQDSKGRDGTIFYSTLPLPPAYERSDISMQLCMWDEYHIFLITSLEYIRLLLDEISQFIKLPFDWLNVNFCFFTGWFNSRFCYSNLTWETDGIKLTSLLANRLTKYASHP